MILNYIKRLIDGRDSADAKNAVGLVSFVYVIVAASVDLFSKWHPTEFVFYGMLGLVVGVFGLSTIVDSKAMQVKADVASNMLSSTSAPANVKAAKDVLQSDSPPGGHDTGIDSTTSK